jgi:hypothetical protein
VGELYVSASEIEVYDLCHRKWAFGYIEKKRAPPNEAAALGTRVHKILERWLTAGEAPNTWTDEGSIAASGLHLLPPPRTPTLVTEEQFRFTSSRAWYMGFKDFRYRDSNGLIHVGDHKTTKAAMWMKSVEDILAHPQALIYAVDEFFKNPQDDRLALDWIYYKTTGSRKAEPRFQIVTKDVVAEMFFEHVDPVAGEITKLHNEVPPGTSALDFPPDFRACDAYGGCPFLSICNPTPTQRVQATMTQAGLSLADKLKAMKNGRAPSPIHPPEAYQQPAQAQPAAPMPAGYQPPQAPAAAAPAPPVQFSLPVPQGALVAPMDPLAQAAPPAVQQPSVNLAPPPAVEVPPAELKKQRGRPKKNVTEIASVVAEVSYATSEGFVLYVNCAPIGIEVTDALEYVNAAHEQLLENYAVQVPTISHYREILYGKGPAELCKTLEGILASLPAAGDVVLGSTQIEEDTASVWLSLAAKVVRAFR